MPAAKKDLKTSFWSEKLIINIIRFVLVLVPFFAFISVWLSSATGHFTVVRLWDDALLLVITIYAIYFLPRAKLLWSFITSDWLTSLIFAYALLTILLGISSYSQHNVSAKALFYGLLINLRFLLWFVAVRLIASKMPKIKSNLDKFIFYPLFLVVIFGMLQFFVLPAHFLSHFGYGVNTYPQFITINQNTSTIRIQSFLRGANPLGAYLAVLICILVAYLIFNKKKLMYWLLLPISLLALYLTFSRSAIIGLIIGLLVIIYLTIKSPKVKKAFYISLACLLIILGVGYFATKNNSGVQDIIFHHSSHSTAKVTSDQGHLQAFKNNVKVILHNPLGKGPGTSGQASWYNSGHSVINPEDYYVQIGEETGWLGLILFASIIVTVGYRLWKLDKNWLAIGLLGGLVAASVLSVFTYSWSDDTLAFLWWGLAAICLGASASSKRSL